MYESSSEIKLEVKSDAIEFGFGGFMDNKNLSVMSGEIELIKSKLFFSKLIDSIKLDISYYTVGNFLDDEKYPSSPLKFTYNLKNDQWIDRRIYIELEKGNTYKISFDDDFKNFTSHSLGEKVQTESIEFTLNTTDFYQDSMDPKFFITINSREALLQYLKNNLTVEPLNLNANTIKISFQDHNLAKARDLVNAINQIYIKYTLQEKQRANLNKIKWLDNQLGKIEEQLDGFENYFENFTIENRTSNLDEDLRNTINQISDLDSVQYNYENSLNSLEDILLKIDSNQIINYSRGLPSQLTTSINTLNNLLIEIDQLGLSYKETTYAMQRKEREIQNMKESIREMASGMISDLRKKRNSLLNRRKKLEKNFVQIPGKSTDYNKKQRYYKLYENFYLSLMESKAEFEIAVAGLTPDFKVLSTASYPQFPIYPNRNLIYGGGLFVGLLLSFISIVITYLLDNKINTTDELENIISLPILGSLPKSKSKMEVSQLVVDQHLRSGISESMRSIRTNIQFMVPDTNKKVYLVTSTVGGEGKTFISINLGGILALSKKKVIILDLDMRKPKIHLSFNPELPNTKGISTILINKHSIEECTRTTRLDSLDYIPAGPTPPNPSELLMNGAFQNLLEKLKKQYDLIILDTPPVGLVTDGILAMKQSNLNIYVVRSNYTKKKDLRAIERITSIRDYPMSLILNSITSETKYGYSYGYYSDKKS